MVLSQTVFKKNTFWLKNLNKTPNYNKGLEMNFKDTVLACFENKQLVVEYDRLNGTNLSKRLTPIENAIDEATGHKEKELLGFICFVDHFIWSPVVADSRNVIPKDGF